jgi:hypothetical protein
MLTEFAAFAGSFAAALAGSGCRLPADSAMRGLAAVR